MRRPNREISIFTLSALDVLAMSAGVFVLLLVMLMPYHRKVLDAHAAIEAARIAEAETVAHVQTLEEQGTLHRAEADAAEAEAAAVLAQAASLRQAAAEQRQEALRQAVASQVQEGDVTTPVIDAIDLVFVIDTTASMGPVLREVAHSLRGIVRILERLVPSLRVGVVAYNDRDTGRMPVVTLPPTPTDHGLARVVAFIEGLSASTVGSRTVEEDLYLGLTTATALPLRPGAKQALVVVGDAAAHPARAGPGAVSRRELRAGPRQPQHLDAVRDDAVVHAARQRRARLLRRAGERRRRQLHRSRRQHDRGRSSIGVRRLATRPGTAPEVRRGPGCCGSWRRSCGSATGCRRSPPPPG